MALPHPSSFLLPFAPLPSFYLSNYDTARFHHNYTSTATSSFWDTLNSAAAYGGNQAAALSHQSLFYKPMTMTTTTPTESQTQAAAKLTQVQMEQQKEDEEVEVTSSEETKPTMDLLPETTAKIFMLVMKWIKAMPSFMQLPINDKKLMIEAAWAELVVVTAAQWGLPIQPGKKKGTPIKVAIFLILLFYFLLNRGSK